MDRLNEKEIRILIVDDEEEILTLYQRVLGDNESHDPQLQRLKHLEDSLFSSQSVIPAAVAYDLTLCRQGDEAVRAMELALREDRPYALAFVDIRMPPGPDGLWTSEHLRKLDPFVNITLVTAYADVTPADILHRIPPAGNLLYVQKPLLHLEICQIAAVLAAKWRSEWRLRELETDNFTKREVG
ncbi:MAG: hypothetical protein KJ950_11905 [Proteobacteria bacterium]|nr:hypothetical protein [Pseudomonadota bacterium]MBU1688035.1 hypothetical protein [Pseudomonadota bacterium]